MRAILDWVYQRLGNDQWEKYGVKAVNEQTAYQTPGNSHTSRQAAAELLYASLTGDTSRREMAIRQLHWATYMVDHDGKNNYPRDEVWLTDGYGDYVRHYLRAMASYPPLSPVGNHLLRSSSVLSSIKYGNDKIDYVAFDKAGEELLRLKAKPAAVKGAVKWTWKELAEGGIVSISRTKSKHVVISF